MQFKCCTRSQDTKGQVKEAVSVLEVAAHKVRLERLHRGERVEPMGLGSGRPEFESLLRHLLQQNDLR